MIPVNAIAISTGKKISITGVKIVPKPNPEKKVRIAAENVTKQIIIISIIYSGTIIENVFQIEIMKKIIFLIVSLSLSCSSDSSDYGYGEYDNGDSYNNSSDSGYPVSVSPNGMSDYVLSGKDRNGDISGNDPQIEFKVGDKISFTVSASGHPFYLKTKASVGTADIIMGISNNGTSIGKISWTPTQAGTFYYQCSLHADMSGMIVITE